MIYEDKLIDGLVEEITNQCPHIVEIKLKLSRERYRLFDIYVNKVLASNDLDYAGTVSYLHGMLEIIELS